jgi:hypothetical protein
MKKFGLREEMFIRKRMKRVLPLYARGRATIERYSRESGELLGVIGPVLNAIDAEGFDEFLLNIAGTSAKNLGSNGPHLDATQASVGIATSATPVSYLYSKVGTTTGPSAGVNTKNAPTYTMRWEWHDISANTYSNAAWLHFWYGDPVGVAGDEYRVASVNIAAGNKPADENWLYKFDLELYSTDTDFTTGAMQILMDLFSGVQAVHLNATGIKLRPTTGAGTGSEISGTDQLPDGAPTVDTGADKITWVWTVVDGNFEGTWAGTKVKIGSGFSTNLRWGGCKTDGSSCGVKSAGEEWEYTYIITVAQGS